MGLKMVSFPFLPSFNQIIFSVTVQMNRYLGRRQSMNTTKPCLTLRLKERYNTTSNMKGCYLGKIQKEIEQNYRFINILFDISGLFQGTDFQVPSCLYTRWKSLDLGQGTFFFDSCRQLSIGRKYHLNIIRGWACSLVCINSPPF